MVEISQSAAFYASPETARRLRKRRRAETRLRLYGIAAIALAALALVALLSSVLGKATGALSESYLVLPIELESGKIDPKGKGDYTTILRADFNGLVKRMLRDRFPSVKTRSEKRDLYDLVSGGATFELAEKVANDPSLVGQTIDYRFLASDLTDLYLKGSYGELRAQKTSGQLTIVAEADAYRIESTSEDFISAVNEVSKTLLKTAKSLRVQAKLQENGNRVFTEQATKIADPDEKAALLAEAKSRAAERDRLLAEAEDLTARATRQDQIEALSAANKSVLLKAGGGWFKLTSVAKSTATAVAILPPTTETTQSTDWQMLISDLPEDSRKVSDNQMVWIEVLKAEGRTDTVFNTRFFTAGDSREPELAGVWGAVVGTFWTMLVTFALAFPIGVSTAIYLEEFAPRNRLTDLIEVNINNLAAVPSIVFGLLGLAVFLTIFGVPRSSPLAGGMVLALMTLPTIIIAARAAIRAVPPSIRDAALGIGASKLQTSFHHVLPLAMPGILTGTIIGMAQALGETAPLILIGMVAFIVDIPSAVTDSATVLPVQIYRWSDFPERAFEARTAAAICVLLVFLIIMNALAIFLRKKFEIRW